MRLCFSTLGCPAWSLARVIDEGARMGYDGVELRFLENDDALWERAELKGEGLRETRARFADAGLGVPASTRAPSSTARTRPRGGRPWTRRRARARSPPSSGLRASACSATASSPARISRRRGNGSWRRSARCATVLRGSGVEVWLETHGDFATATASRELVEQAAASGIGVVWDAANAYSEFGEAPEAGFATLGGFVRHVHLKDARRPADGRIPWPPVLTGTGDFPAARTLELLRRARYDRWLSYEWEKRWHPAIEEPEVALPHFLGWASAGLRQRKDEAPATGRLLAVGRMRIEVHEDRPAVGRAAAAAIADEIRTLVKRDGKAAVIFASAPSQNEFLAELRQAPGIDWSKLTAFHLDEYVGVGPDHPASFRRFLIDRLFSHVKVAAFHGLDGQAKDLAAECARYTQLLHHEAPRLAILGIGENGHLAFIDPPVCDFAEPADVRVVELDEPCRRQQVNDGCFASLEEVPRTALSLTIPFLLRVPRAVAIVPGPAKRAAITAAVRGPVTRACPASILRRHPDATLVLDEASAAGLR